MSPDMPKAQKPIGRLKPFRASVIVLVVGRGGHKISVVQREQGIPVARDSTKDENEGSMDKAKGRAKEAVGSMSGNKDLKYQGSSDQDKGTLKKKGAAKDLLS